MTEMEILQTTTDPIEMDMGDPVIEYSPVLPNPEGEPTDDLTKVQIQGNIYQIKDPEVYDWARAEEKPTYTKAEVGLGNVDNTSDMDKPVSTATQTALDNKVDKVAGKGLSEEDFTHTLKNKLDGIEAGAEVNTVNSVAGKTGNITLDKSDVGLGNVDNTSDMNKPVSTATQEALQGLASATQTALNGKVDNSTLNNYYTKTETDTALGNKVDKVQGKGLSSNDYTDTEKALVGTIEDKLDKTETAVNSNGLVIATPVTDTAPYIYRQTPVKESFKVLMKKIVGASVVWNQIMPYGNYASMEGIVSLSGSSTSVANNTATCVISANFGGFQMTIDKYEPTHKYLVSSVIKTSANRTTIGFGLSDASSHFKIRKTISTTTSFAQYCFVGTMTDTETGTLTNPRFMIFDTQGSQGVTIDIQKSFAVDLTAMFGTTIADYVYTLETSQSGSGIAWLQSYGFFTEDYYAYKQNKLESGCVSAHKTYNGETLLTNTELSPITLRGLFKLSTDKLTVDGDEYNADGSVTRKYGIVDLETLGWNLHTSGTFYASLGTKKRGSLNLICDSYTSLDVSFSFNNYDSYPDKVIGSNTDSASGIYVFVKNTAYTDTQTFTNAMRGVYLIYELATPTIEQTTPFTETEIVGSTEEFIDYEVAQGNRDVAIPVGTETDYYQEMKLPSLPTTSGNHNLIYNIATGFGWS